MGCGLSVEKKEFNLSKLEVEIEKEKKDKMPFFSFNGQKFKARIVDVYDGDTFYACFYLKDDIIKMKCRAYGYDSPEMKPPLNNFNREQVKEMANQARERFMQLVNFDEPGFLVTLECKEFDKYGRLLCEVYVDDVNINQIMVVEGQGKPYYGGSKDVIESVNIEIKKDDVKQEEKKEEVKKIDRKVSVRK